MKHMVREKEGFNQYVNGVLPGAAQEEGHHSAPVEHVPLTSAESFTSQTTSACRCNYFFFIKSRPTKNQYIYSLVSLATTTRSGPYGCWVSWETSLSTSQSGPYGCWVSWETSLSTTQSGPYGCWVSWETSLSTTQVLGATK